MPPVHDRVEVAVLDDICKPDGLTILTPAADTVIVYVVSLLVVISYVKYDCRVYPCAVIELDSSVVAAIHSSYEVGEYRSLKFPAGLVSQTKFPTRCSLRISALLIYSLSLER